MIRLVKSETFAFIALVALIIIVSVVCLIVFWGWLGSGADSSESNGEKIRNVSIVIGGIIALVFAIWRSLVSGRQAKTAQQDLLQERYHKSTEMLGSNLLAVRLGGIYSLQQLSKDHSEQFHIPITRQLCAFLRHPPSQVGDCNSTTSELVDTYDQIDRMVETSDSARWGYPSFRSHQDVQSIVDILSLRDSKIRKFEVDNRFKLDLRGAYLKNVWLKLGDFSDANLAHANLADAYCVGTNLSKTHLVGANLSHASLMSVDVSLSLLELADLSGARLVNSSLRDTRLSGSNLTSVVFVGSDLSGAKLSSANLENSDLWMVNLTGADFGAEEGRQPGHHKLPARGLTQSQINEACADLKNPPRFTGVIDAETGKQLIWRGKSLEDYTGWKSSVESKVMAQRLRDSSPHSE